MFAFSHRTGAYLTLLACLQAGACSKAESEHDAASGGSGGNTQTGTVFGGSGGNTQTGNGSGAGGSTVTNGTTPTNPALLSDGSSKEVSTGGLFYTFLDRSGKSSVSPFTGKVDILDPMASALEAPLALGHGIESASGDNFAFHIAGKVAAAPLWSRTLSADPTWGDPYWDKPYGASCLDGTCGMVAYPEAGLGLSLLPHNQPMDLSAYVGVKFSYKVGQLHGKLVSGEFAPLTLRVPMDLTDIPDVGLADWFGAKQADGSWLPLCSFPSTKAANGTAVGSTNLTCTAHFQQTVQVASPEVWATACAVWSAIPQPSWAVAGLTAAGITALRPARINKLEWVAYKPTSNETDTAFDFWLDDVQLLTCNDVMSLCSDVATLPAECQ